MGPMSIRVASYFPFNVTHPLNGHSFVAQELTRAGIRFRKSIMPSWLWRMWPHCGPPGGTGLHRP
jgi:hypothetical protein